MAWSGRWLDVRADVRFLSSVDPTLLDHPMVREAGCCPLCGTEAPPLARLWRQRRVIETIVAAETETFDRPAFGPAQELRMPPYVGCGHLVWLPLPLWRTAFGRCYYARRPREWEPRL